MSIFKKVTSVLDKGDGDNYLALLVTYEGVEVALWKIENKRLKILAKGKSRFVGGGNILESTADAIDQACEPLDIEAKEIILGLPDSWISQNQILPQYLNRLKDLAKDLDVSPFAFVSQNHALSNRIKIKYGTSAVGFLLNIDRENVTLSAVIGGHLGESRFLHSAGDDYTTALQRLFSQFTTAPAQAKTVYVNGGPSLAALRQIFETIPLLAQSQPEVVQLEPGFAIDALALAGAIDRGNAQGITVEDMVADNATIAQVTPPVAEEKGPDMPMANIDDEAGSVKGKAASEDDEKKPAGIVDGDEKSDEAVAISDQAASDDDSEKNAALAAGSAMAAGIAETAPVSVAEAATQTAEKLPEGFVAGEDISKAGAGSSTPSESEKPDEISETAESGKGKAESEDVEKTEEISEISPENTVQPANIAASQTVEAGQETESNFERVSPAVAGPIIHEANVPQQVRPIENLPNPFSAKPAEQDAMEAAGPLENLPEDEESSGGMPLVGPIIGLVTSILSIVFAIPKKIFGIFGGKVAPIIILIVLIILGNIVAFVVVPKATVTITFTPHVLSDSVDLTVDPSASGVDATNNTIPGHLITAEVSGNASGQATGSKQIGNKATGTITIFNKTDQDKTLAAGATLTNGQMSFTLNSATTVPASTITESEDSATTTFGKTTASATASDIGTGGNISGGTTLAVGNESKDSFDATAASDFSGGSSQTVTVISDSDMKQAENSLTQQLKGQAASQLTAKVGGGEQVIDQATKIEAPKFTPSANVGDQAASFTVSAQAQANETAYNTSDLQSFLNQLIQGKIPDGFTLATTDNTAEPTFSKIDKNGVITLNWNYQAKLLPQFDMTTLEKDLVGQSFSQADAVIQKIPNVASVTTVITPSFFEFAHRLPFRSSNITIMTQSQ